MLNKKNYLKILVLAVCLISLIEIISAATGGSQEVRVNILPEFLLVNSPANDKTYNSSLIDVNVTLDMLGSKIEIIKWTFDKHSWRTLCTNCYSYGNFKDKTRAFKEGDSEVEFRLIGPGNNIVQEKIVKFAIDSKKPVILKTQPSSGSATNGNGFYLKYSEENLKEITLTLYYGNEKTKITKTNQECLPGNRQECFFEVDISKYNNKWIQYQFKVSDYASTEDTKRIPIFVDMINPTITINSPQDEYFNSRTIPFNITVDEYSTIQYMDLNERNAVWKELCKNCIEFGASKKITKSFSNGAHTLLIRATDYAGNYETKTVVLNVKSKSFLFW